MSPQSASRGPVERGFVERIHCPDTEQLAASVGGLGRTYDDFCLIFGIPWSQRPKFVQGSLGPVPFSGAHTACTCKPGEVFLGASNEVWFHRFSSPPFGSPFIPSPSHTFASSFLSCPPVFMSGHLILFFVCAHIGPGLSVYVHFYIHSHRFQVAQVFTMRWASSVVPVHLVPLSFPPHAPLSRLVLLSCLHSFVSCARTRAHLPSP